MVAFLQLVPDLRPVSPVAVTAGCYYRKASNDYVKLDGCYFLSNYDGDSQSADSMSCDSDSDSEVDVDFDMDREPDLLMMGHTPPGGLLHLLTNSLVFAHIAPYLSAGDKFNLAATSKALHALVRGTPFVFKYLDLTHLQRFAAPTQDTTACSAVSANANGLWHGHWRDALARRLPHPYHGVFDHLHARRWLASVTTLILDNTHVDAGLVRDLLTSPSCNVRILSLRSTPSLDKDALRSLLKELCDQKQKQAAPVGALKLKGLYVFGADAATVAYHTDPWTGTLDHPLPRVGDSTSDLWYRQRGRVLISSGTLLADDDWAATLVDCRGKIAFDGVLCNGPRHANSPAFGRTRGLNISPAYLGRRRIPLSRLPPGAPNAPQAMAAVALDGCAGCGSAPEGWTTWGDDDVHDARDAGAASQFPLLWPPPRLSSNVRVAMCPDGEPLYPHKARHPATPPSRFIARCEWCVYGRLCACCMRWWCESCRPDSVVHGIVPAVGVDEDGAASVAKPLMTYSCRECGPTCPDCLAKTERSCARCRQLYCVVHNAGCTSTHCDWCSASMIRSRQPIRRAACVSRV